MSSIFVLGLQDIATPTYLHGDHDSRCTVLQQLIRIGEICSYTSRDDISTDDFLTDNGIIVEDRENKKELHPSKKHLSLNLYKFNYEIGRKEYVVHGKAERRIKIIFDNHLQENVFPELENTENNVMVRKLRFTFISLLLKHYSRRNIRFIHDNNLTNSRRQLAMILRNHQNFAIVLFASILMKSY